ncbi:hypothetical protein ACXO2W_05590 [Lactobacillus delbrueckii subsp. bulgaricus]
MKKRYYFMDLMAIVSSFAVLMLHTSGNATYLKVVVNRFTPDGLCSIRRLFYQTGQQGSCPLHLLEHSGLYYV